MKVTFLGTGTSQGVPVIGCDCEVCQSADPRDQRLRPALLLETAGVRVVIDCGPDFRQQMIRARVPGIDAIVITHEHNDHVIGLDDVRPFNFMQKKDMPVYATRAVMKELQNRFAYAFAAERYPGSPMIHLVPIEKSSRFRIADMDFLPVEVLHGGMPVLGFRIGDFAYLTDMKTIAPEELVKLSGVDTLVVTALHHTPHHSHLILVDALSFFGEVRPRRAFLTHMSHRMGKHQEVSAQLPSNVQFAYDGLQLFW